MIVPLPHLATGRPTGPRSLVGKAAVCPASLRWKILGEAKPCGNFISFWCALMKSAKKWIKLLLKKMDLRKKTHSRGPPHHPPPFAGYSVIFEKKTE